MIKRLVQNITSISLETPSVCSVWDKGYRYGFNGKEIDKGDEGMGGGGSTYDYGFRIYNPSLGKFLSVDPLTASYPWYTPYQFAGNMPIWAIDLDGLEEKKITKVTYNLLQIFIFNDEELKERTEGITSIGGGPNKILVGNDGVMIFATNIESAYNLINNYETSNGKEFSFNNVAFSMHGTFDEEKNQSGLKANTETDEKITTENWDNSCDKDFLIRLAVKSNKNVIFTSCKLGNDNDLVKKIYNSIKRPDKKISLFFSKINNLTTFKLKTTIETVTKTNIESGQSEVTKTENYEFTISHKNTNDSKFIELSTNNEGVEEEKVVTMKSQKMHLKPQTTKNQ